MTMKEWRNWGMGHLILTHLILEFHEERTTQKLCCHGLEQLLQLPHLPIGCAHEATKRDLSFGKQLAGLTSTAGDKSIVETWGQEGYVIFLGAVSSSWKSTSSTLTGVR